jgi:hypothetical protein
VGEQEESTRPITDLELNFAADPLVDLSELHLLAESNFDDGEYEGALMRYIEVFEGSRELPEWQDKRLNILLADMAALADVYEPAMLALTAIRDEKEAALINVKAEWNDVSEWAALNRQLEPDRTMAIYYKLKAETNQNAPTLSLIRQIESSSFIRQGLYQELDQQTLAHLQKKVLLHESVLLSSREGDSTSEGEQEESLENTIEALLGVALELFEAAAALKEGDIGRETMKKYLAYQQEDNAYSKLINAAKKTNNQVWVDGLQKLAANKKS